MWPRSLSRAQLGWLASTSGSSDVGLHLAHAPVSGATGSDRSSPSRGSFSPLFDNSAFRLAIARCSSCSSSMWSYGSLKPNKSQLFVLAEPTTVLLVASPTQLL